MSSTPCIIYTMYHLHRVSSTPCIIYTMYHLHHVSSTPCIIYTMYHLHHVSFTPCMIYTMYHLHHVSFTPCIIYTIYHDPCTPCTMYINNTGAFSCNSFATLSRLLAVHSFIIVQCNNSIIVSGLFTVFAIMLY